MLQMKVSCSNGRLLKLFCSGLARFVTCISFVLTICNYFRPAMCISEGKSYKNGQCYIFTNDTIPKVCGETVNYTHWVSTLRNYRLKFCSMIKLETAFGGNFQNRTFCESRWNALMESDSQAEIFAKGFETVLDHFDCQNYSVRGNCTECMEAYKNWACSENIVIYENQTLRQPCREYCRNVLQACPYLLPDDDYGLPAFDCTTLELGESTILFDSPNCFEVFPPDDCQVRTIPTEAPAPTSAVVSVISSPEIKPTTTQQPTPPPAITTEEPTTTEEGTVPPTTTEEGTVPPATTEEGTVPPATTEEFTPPLTTSEIPSTEFNSTDEVPTITSKNIKNATAIIDTPS